MATYNSTAAIDAILRANSVPVEAEMQAAQNNYDAAVKRLEAQKAAEDAQAYRSFERQKRELPEVMAMNGAQGGMVDSAVASMENNYMNNRNARALQLADNLADQQLNHDNAMLQLRAKLAAYQQQALADKAEAAYAAAKLKTPDTPFRDYQTVINDRMTTADKKGVMFAGGGGTRRVHEVK